MVAIGVILSGNQRPNGIYRQVGEDADGLSIINIVWLDMRRMLRPPYDGDWEHDHVSSLHPQPLLSSFVYWGFPIR